MIFICGSAFLRVCCSYVFGVFRQIYNFCRTSSTCSSMLVCTDEIWRYVMFISRGHIYIHTTYIYRFLLGRRAPKLMWTGWDRNLLAFWSFAWSWHRSARKLQIDPLLEVFTSVTVGWVRLGFSVRSNVINPPTTKPPGSPSGRISAATLTGTHRFRSHQSWLVIAIFLMIIIITSGDCARLSALYLY